MSLASGLGSLQLLVAQQLLESAAISHAFVVNQKKDGTGIPPGLQKISASCRRLGVGDNLNVRHRPISNIRFESPLRGHFFALPSPLHHAA
jgi:hypothetical protein